MSMKHSAPLFVPVTVMVSDIPAGLNPECMHRDEFPAEAVTKVHEFCHLRLGIPVNWLVCAATVERMGDTFRSWRTQYGDEVGIFEWGVWGGEHAGGGVQSWCEAVGLERPAGRLLKAWWELSEEEAGRAALYLKEYFDTRLDSDTTTIFGANAGDAAARAFRKAGFKTMWGYNWNLYGDGVDATGRGCLPYPFYIHPRHAKAPAEPGDKGLLGVPWGAGDAANFWGLVRQSRLAINNICLNAHELANRSGALDQYQYVQRYFPMMKEQCDWNPFIYVPLQIEAVWLDESGSFYRHHPDFPARASETFFHEISAARDNGARFVTHREFRDWYAERFEETPEMLLYYQDLLPDTPIRGKDQAFQPTLLYGSAGRQVIFEKSRGFNPARTYRYRPVVPCSDPGAEYPGEGEPEVELKVREWTTPAFGVALSERGARYQVSYLGTPGLGLTAARDYPDYDCVLWHFNLPEYIAPEELEVSENISGVRLLRRHNLAIVSASLTAGDNLLEIASAKPDAFLSLETPRRRGRRCEIYIRNSGPPVGLSELEVQLEANLQLGGFWWDGRYYDSVYHFQYSPYDWRTGVMKLFTSYPAALPVRTGFTRCSFEILGNY